MGAGLDPRTFPQFNAAGNMDTVLRGVINSLTISGATTLLESAITGFPAGWVAPLPGTLFCLSGAQKAPVGANLSVAVKINSANSGFATNPLATNNTIQTYVQTAPSIIQFNAGDIITLAVVPDSTVIGCSISAALAVLM